MGKFKRFLKRQLSYQPSPSPTQCQVSDEGALPRMRLTNPPNNRHFHEKNYLDGSLFVVPTRYTFLSDSILASGGQGVVIVAHDRVTHKDVVIKKLKNPFAPEHLARRTNREFILSQIVNHENVIQLLSAFTPEDNFQEFSDFYIVTEYVRYPLKYIVSRRDAVFSSQDGDYKLAYILRQIMCGIRHLHHTGIIHRDLSILNIQVSEKLEVKIIDLGMAREMPGDRDVNMSSYVTTKFYRAPEVILNITYDEKVDIWSIGCIFAEILLGTPMFCADTVQLWQAITEKLGTPSQDFINKFVPEISKFMMQLPVYPPKPWEELFPDNIFPNRGIYERPDTTPANGRDLLSKMLVIDPTYRISIDQALEHPFVEWPDMVDSATPPLSKYTAHIEGVKLNEDMWKILLFGQIKQYERDHNIHGKIGEPQNCDTCLKYKCDCQACTSMEINIPNGI